MFKNNKEKSIAALKKARLIVGRMIKMVEAGECCEKILSQNVVAVSLLRHAHKLNMEMDLSDCLKSMVKNKNQAKNRETTEKIMTVTKQFIR